MGTLAGIKVGKFYDVVTHSGTYGVDFEELCHFRCVVLEKGERFILVRTEHGFCECLGNCDVLSGRVIFRESEAL